MWKHNAIAERYYEWLKEAVYQSGKGYKAITEHSELDWQLQNILDSCQSCWEQTHSDWAIIVQKESMTFLEGLQDKRSFL